MNHPSNTGREAEQFAGKVGNDHSQLSQVVFAMQYHYQSCSSVLESAPNEKQNRAAERFLQLEHKAIKALAKVVMVESMPTQEQLKQGNFTLSPVHTFEDMYLANERLLANIKFKFKAILNERLSSVLSYWLAALQVEHDDLAKHLTLN